MGSGKSTVGRRLARELGWAFRDFDEVIEETVGKPVARIFADDGEPAFREMEARIGAELLALDRVVLASGGGWPCTPGRMESLPEGTLSIWLRVHPEEAVDRARKGYRRRPLLQNEDPEGTLKELLRHRLPFYKMADWTEEGGAESPAEVAKRLAHRLLTGGADSPPPGRHHEPAAPEPRT